MINKDDFFKSTKANWKFKKELKWGSIAMKNFIKKADFVSNSGSSYKYTQRGVYRMSDHFNDHVASCSWMLDGKESEYKCIVAYCCWKDFERIETSFHGIAGYWDKWDFVPMNGMSIEEFRIKHIYA